MKGRNTQYGGCFRLDSLPYRPAESLSRSCPLSITEGLKAISFSGLQKSASGPLGDVDVSFGGAYNVLSATFFGVLGNYSVAGFTRQVPEGGTTLALLGIGLIGVSLLRSRKLVPAKESVRIDR